VKQEQANQGLLSWPLYLFEQAKLVRADRYITSRLDNLKYLTIVERVYVVTQIMIFQHKLGMILSATSGDGSSAMFSLASLTSTRISQPDQLALKQHGVKHGLH